MHINPKRMKRRVNNAPAVYGDPEVIYDETIEPEYLKIKGYKERAAALGLTICRNYKGGYSLEGEFLDIIDEGVLFFDNLEDMRAEINNLWSVATEPEIICYYDNEGLYHECIAYPETLL